MPPKPPVGQGLLPGTEVPVEPREFRPDERVAISGMIKWFSDVRGVDSGTVTERDCVRLQPDYIERGLYVPQGQDEKKFPQASGHVIFPASEYRLLTRSPERVAEAAATAVRNKRSSHGDKAEVEQVAGRASAHALNSQIERTRSLIDALQMKQDALTTIRNELMSARGTGFFAHYKADDVKIIVVNGETAIFEALDVCAMTKGWNAEQLERAKRTLIYKLFGDHSDRFKNWKEFSLMAHQYTRKRKLVMTAALHKLQKKYRDFDHFLDET